MKFGYSYKTSDGVRHESTFEAKSNEAVFAALRAQGIKPMKVWEIHSPYYISKRTRLIIVLALALAASLVYTIRLSKTYHSSLITHHSDALASPRHQIYGDPAIWENIERDNFASVFKSSGDRILALYAIPGRAVTDSLGLSRAALLKALEDCKDEDVKKINLVFGIRTGNANHKFDHETIVLLINNDIPNRDIADSIASTIGRNLKSILMVAAGTTADWLEDHLS